MIVREFVICCCGFYGALIYLIKHNERCCRRRELGRKEVERDGVGVGKGEREW